MKPRTLLLVTALVVVVVFALYRMDTQNPVHVGVSHVMQNITRSHLPLPYATPPAPEQWQTMNAADRLANVRSRLLPKLHDELAARQLRLGQPAFIRIFKESHELELWLQYNEGWQLFRTYPIACFSGTLGPKTREGDMQAPEGFYNVTRKQLNPASSYHLSFNIGYPNAYDLQLQRTGSLIMVHGDTCSIGCFAMTDPLIEEIYLVVEAALKDTGTVPVHVFPFRMNASRMKQAEFNSETAHLASWREIEPAYHLFEGTHRVPHITVENGRYQAK
jgi:murein L,D-transpeptidase YafK